MNRREFLSSVGVGVGGIVSGVAAPNINKGRKRIRTQALVIGSGFGGAVSALRLGEAGVKTIVLERGKRWDVVPGQPGPFGGIGFDSQGNAFGDGRLGWLTEQYDVPGVPTFGINKFTGVLEVIDGAGMTVLAGAGVGGGSLVYGATLAQPSRAAFYQAFQQQLGFLDYDELDQVYYPIAKSMLGATNVRAALDQLAAIFGPAVSQFGLNPYLTWEAFLSAEAEADLAESTFPDRFRKVLLDGGVNFQIVAQEIQSLLAQFSGGTPTVEPSFTTGAFSLFGANSGAKNSVDRNYLPAAEATGKVEVLPLHQVDYIRRQGNSYEVIVDRIDTEGNVVEGFIFSTKFLIMAAGSVGTTKLLLKSKAMGMELPDGVGENWGTNGDLLGSRQNIGTLGSVVNPQGLPLPIIGGPATALIEDISGPLGSASLEYAGGLGQMQTLGQVVAGAGLGSIAYDGGSDSAVPVWPEFAQNLVLGAIFGGPGLPKPGINALLDTLPKAPGCSFDRFAGLQVDPTCVPLPTGPFDPSCVPVPTPAEQAALAGCLARPNTYHPLGGAVYGSVCDGDGEVFDNQGLLIMDGSLIPGSTGAVNPALTITALAERNINNQLSGRSRLGRFVS